jgi:hypothetical protein
MTRMLIAAITAVCMASSANAAMNRIEKGQQLKKLHRMYLQGVRDGLLAYNRQLETDTHHGVEAASRTFACHVILILRLIKRRNWHLERWTIPRAIYRMAPAISTNDTTFPFRGYC